MGFFDRFFNRKVSATVPVRTLFLTPGQGVRAKQDFKAQAEDGYLRNPTVYSCVREIAESAAGIPWMLYRRTRGGDRAEIMSHPLLDLLENPNPMQGRHEFVEAVMGYLYLSGNAYIESVGPDRPGSAPLELYALRPDRMKVMPDPVHLVGGYKYTVSGNEYRFPREAITHVKLFHPLDDFYGLSPVQAAALAIDKTNEGDVWQISSMQNMAVPSGMVKVDGSLTDSQFDRLKAQVASEYTGAKNARVPMLGEGGLTWQEMGMSPRDMDWLEGSRFSALQIAQVFNMPPELIGLQPATYQNRKEARKALYTETAIPALKRLRDALNTSVTPRFGADLYLDYNADGVEAMADDIDKLFERAQGSNFLTVNEKRAMVGYDPVPEGDVIITAFSDSTLDDLASGGGLVSPATPDDVRSITGGLDLKMVNLNRRERQREIQTILRLRRRFEKSLERDVSGLFLAEARMVERAVESSGIDNAVAAVNTHADAWSEKLQRHYTNVMLSFGNRTLAGLKMGPGEREIKAAEDVFSSEALKFAREFAGQKVGEISDTTRAKVNEIIRLGLEEGRGVPEIIAELLELYEGFAEGGRAGAIALTETMIAQNKAQLEAALTLETDGLMKEWLWSGVSRETHAVVDGTFVPVKESFLVGGEPMAHPGDPSASAENIINCKCTIAFRRN